MSEVEKMYENAGVEPKYKDYRTKNGKIYEDKNPNNRNIRLLYPPFTAEKQLELLLFCTIWGQVHIIRGIDDGYRIENCCYRYGYQPTIAEAIANHLNEKWHILTAEQQEQIAEILGG